MGSKSNKRKCDGDSSDLVPRVFSLKRDEMAYRFLFPAMSFDELNYDPKGYLYVKAVSL